MEKVQEAGQTTLAPRTRMHLPHIHCQKYSQEDVIANSLVSFGGRLQMTSRLKRVKGL